MRTAALVPARAGSKGIPNKNARPFDGKPLLHWAVQIGLETCDWTFLSTEDEHLARLGREAGAAIIDRPESLATDHASMRAVVRHALEKMPAEVEAVVLLQPTQPFRTEAHVRAAVDTLARSTADSVVSVVMIPPHQSPDYAMRMGNWGWLEPWVLDSPTRRQDCRTAYYRDGTVYAMRRETIESGSLYGRKCYPVIIPPDESVTLDTPADWDRAEARLRDHNG